MKSAERLTIIIISSGLTKKGRLPFFVRNRLDHAYKLYHQNPSNRIIVSGKSSLFVEEAQNQTDAEVMSQYLQSLGVDKKNIMKEEYSKDLISSAYFIKKAILIPKKIKQVRIVGSDFEDERLIFVFNKVLGTGFSISFDFTHSQITSEVLWDFFSYEREALVNTKAFLRKMKKGDHTFLEGKLFHASLYKEQKIGFIRKYVHEGRIGRRRKAKAHYSMQKIYNKRKTIFNRYNIHLGNKRTLIAGWWSGSFLNFLGKDDENTKYSLKFPLYLKDKNNFIREVSMIDQLGDLPDIFVPEIVDKNIAESPYWYLYKVIPGTMSGNFGQSFSFKKRFLSVETAQTLVSYLKVIRDTTPAVELPQWRSRKYNRRIKDIVSKLQKDKKLLQNTYVQEGISIFKRNIYRFNHTRLFTSHNDLHPANIILGTDQKLYIIDFGIVGLNNIAFDFGLIYLFAWKSPSFRKKFTARFLDSLSDEERQEFEDIFPYMHLFFLIWLLEYTIRFSSIIEKSITMEARKRLLGELKDLVKQLSKLHDTENN